MRLCNFYLALQIPGKNKLLHMSLANAKDLSQFIRKNYAQLEIPFALYKMY